MEEEDIETEKGSFLNTFFSAKSVLVGILALLTAYNTYTTTKTKDELEIASMRIDTAQRKLDFQTTELGNLLKKKEFDNNIKLKMYDETKLAIGKDSITQAATLIIINEMLREDSAFLWQLKGILSRIPNSANRVTSEKKIAIFENQQKAISSGSFTIDVFYLEEIKSEAYPRAQRIAAKLRERYKNYKIRLRLLPASINSQVGYRIGKNTIRHEKSETKLAEELKEIIVGEKVFPLEQPTLQLIQHQTPNYISVFVRNM